MAGLFRVLFGFLGTIGLMAAVTVFFLAIMFVTLMICRYIPLVGRRGRPRD